MEWCGLRGYGWKYRLEDGSRKGFELFLYGVCVSVVRGLRRKVVHYQERCVEIFFASPSWVFLRFRDVLAKCVVVDSECKSGSPGSEGNSEMYVAGFRPREEEEMCYA